MSNDDDFDDTQMVSSFDQTEVASGHMFSIARPQDDGDLVDSTERFDPNFTGMLEPTDRAPGSILRKAGPTLQFHDDDGLDEDSDAFSQTNVAPITADDLDAVAIGSAIDGRFRITGVLGEGGMGKVYQGIQTSINREVAIKVVRPEFAKDPELRARFEREARLISSFSHPNIVRLVDYGESAGRLYLAMEFVNGRPTSHLFGKKQIHPRYALDMTRQVSSALIEAHAKGVVHRDLKPDNILVTRIADGTVQYKVLDFGVARTSASDLTAVGSVCGTPQYMAPEQARGQTVTPASDIYAVGAMLFEVLCGRLPFVGSSPVKLMIMHVQDPIPDIRTLAPHVPQDVAELVMSMMAKNPHERPGSCEQVCERIDLINARHGWTSVIRVPAGPLSETTAGWEVDPAEEARRNSMAHTVDEDSHWLSSGAGIDESFSSNQAPPPKPDLSSRDFSNAVLDLPERSEPIVQPTPAPVAPTTPAPHLPAPMYADPTLTVEREAPRVYTPPTAAPVHTPRSSASVNPSKVNTILTIALGVLVVITLTVGFFVIVKPKLGAGSAGSAIEATGVAKPVFEQIADGGWEIGPIVASSIDTVEVQSGRVKRDGVQVSVSVYTFPDAKQIRQQFDGVFLPNMAYMKDLVMVRVDPPSDGTVTQADVEQVTGFAAKAMPGGEFSITTTR
ncbi:MAG: protein kinase [bacterium]